jgi:lysophospholipase L1-like esterase
MILAALLIPILHPSIFLSPYNSTEKGEWIYAGAYLKTSFTGTSATLHFDASTNLGAPPKFRWSIDGQPLQTAQATRTLELAKNLPNKTHSLTLYLAASDANYDRWNTPTQIIRLESLELDNGATVKPPKNISKKQAIFFGDSITEGAWNLGDSFRVIDKKYVDWVQHSDATQAWPRYLADALKLEYGAAGSGGMGWLKTSHSNIPALPESWRFHYKNHPRNFQRNPDIIFLNMGTNDGTKDTAPVVRQWLAEVHKNLPKTKVILIIPFGQQNKSSLLAAAKSSPRTQVLDLGPAFAEGIQKYGQTTPTSHDGLHPNAGTNRRLADALKPLIRP